MRAVSRILEYGFHRGRIDRLEYSPTPNQIQLVFEITLVQKVDMKH